MSALLTKKVAFFKLISINLKFGGTSGIKEKPKGRLKTKV